MSTATAAANPSATASGRAKAGSTSTSTSTTSAARIEANRRNAQKSTGPRTQAGKDRSRFNALRHGLRASLPVLPGEDESILKNRLDSWTATLAPRDEVERYLVERAVNVSLQLDRADRAWAARLEVDRIAGGAESTDARADEVVRLGRRLFWDPRGPLALYPFFETMLGDPPRCSWMPEVDDPLDPARLVGQLESSALGCAWLLDRWRELRELLEDGLAWQPPDRFKAVRLLGRQPLDAATDDQVLAIYLHSHAIQPEPEWPAKPGSGPASPVADILIELQAGERLRFTGRVEARMARLPAPMDAETGRAYLLDLAAEQEGRLEEILAAHVEREAASEQMRGNFDESDLGERLRRHQVSCNRTILRILEILRRRHREADRASVDGARDNGRGARGKAASDGPVGRAPAAGLASGTPARPGPSSALGAANELPANPTNEPNGRDTEFRTNEPNGRGAGISTNEPNSRGAESPTNEPNGDDSGFPTNEPNGDDSGFPTNEPNPPAPDANPSSGPTGRRPEPALRLARRPSRNRRTNPGPPLSPRAGRLARPGRRPDPPFSSFLDRPNEALAHPGEPPARRHLPSLRPTAGPTGAALVLLLLLLILRLPLGLAAPAAGRPNRGVTDRIAPGAVGTDEPSSRIGSDNFPAVGPGPAAPRPGIVVDSIDPAG